jgi:hypothetical protein
MMSDVVWTSSSSSVNDSNDSDDSDDSNDSDGSDDSYDSTKCNSYLSAPRNSLYLDRCCCSVGGAMSSIKAEHDDDAFFSQGWNLISF